jgi:hypothetical protein
MILGRALELIQTMFAKPTGGGTFGAPANTAPAFGAPAQNTTTGFGGFGASQPTNTGFSFGANTNQAPAFGTAFGTWNVTQTLFVLMVAL